MKFLTFTLVFLMAMLALFADSMLKIAGQKATVFNRFFFMGMAVYASTAFVWFFVLKHTKFSVANLLYSIFTILVSVILGIVVFKESLSPLEIFGICLAVISLIILGRFA